MQEISRIYTTSDLLEEYKKEANKNFYVKSKGHVDEIENAVVLPIHSCRDENGGYFKGGIIDPKGEFYGPSAHIHSLNDDCASLKSGYDFNEDDVINSAQTVIYGGVFFKHIGHFLVESVSRLWYVAQNEKENFPVIFLKEKNKPFPEQITCFLDLLGITKDRLIFVEKPTRFKKIIVPSSSGILGTSYNDNFLLPFQKVASQVPEKPFNKIYLSRRKFKGGVKIIGEDKLENTLKKNGYKVIYPERLSLKEQISYIKGAKEIASIMGSASHLILFAQEGVRSIVFERSTMITREQLRINQAKKADWYSVNAHMNFLPVSHEFSPLLMGINDCVARFFDDHHYLYNKKDVNYIPDRTVRRFARAWFSRYSSDKHNQKLTGLDPIYKERIHLYCRSAFLSLRERLFRKQTSGFYRIYTIFGFSFKVRRYKN